jgi:hypothetical protein
VALKRTAAHPWAQWRCSILFRAVADPLRPSKSVQLLNSVLSPKSWVRLGNHQAADESVLSRICGRCLMEPQSALIHCFNCSATAAISYPASLSKLPNGCQGHPRFYPSPPDRSPITKPDSNCVLRAATFIQLLAWVDIKMHKAVEAWKQKKSV